VPGLEDLDVVVDRTPGDADSHRRGSETSSGMIGPAR
jgi:hypothetical protein